MRHLIINNVGPIKNADVELKKFNYFIGPQSSGKSTVAKIISTCSWIEKEVATSLDEKVIPSGDAFKKLIEGFHKMTGYFNDDSIVRFVTDSICLSFEKGELAVKLKPGINYHRKKTCYIPSERNMVTLPELSDYKLDNNNLKSFLFDWLYAREIFNSSNKAKMLNLGVNYFYDKDELRFKDRIEHNNGKSYSISLFCASSGLQSVIPLIVMLRYYSDEYFSYFDNKSSYNQGDRDRLMRERLADMILLKPLYPFFKDEDRTRLLKEVSDRVESYEPEFVAQYHKYQDALNQLSIPSATTFIIEEPEQNLFPYTQIQLVDFIASLDDKERGHSFTITTHSPYIINALNVMLLRYYKKTGKKDVNPDEINVFSVQDGNVINQVQINTVTGYKSVNIDNLSEAMQDMYDEYRELKNL